MCEECHHLQAKERRTQLFRVNSKATTLPTILIPSEWRKSELVMDEKNCAIPSVFSYKSYKGSRIAK